MSSGKIRIGIVGTGQRVCHHGGCVFTKGPESAGCEDSIVLAALCDNRPDRLVHARRVYRERFGYDIAAYEDYRVMYREAGLDGVYVCGPNDLHRDMTVAALESGLHVLCEKPMEVSLAKCDEMAAAASRAGCILAFAMQMRYRVRYNRIRELIERGDIGAPIMLWCTEYRPPFAEMKDWVWEKARSGGAIVEKNCHHYDIFNLWLESDPTTVYATGGIAKHKTGSGRLSEIVDNAWVVNDYACGARAMLGVCFLADPRQGHHREFGIQGTEGKVFFSHGDGETVHVSRSSGEVLTIRTDEVLRGGVFRDFVDCIRNGGAPLVTSKVARKSMLVPLAAEKSLAEGRVVRVEEIGQVSP